MQIKGKLHAVLEHKQISDTFSTLGFVILVDDNPQYPEYISVQATNERIAAVQQLQIGQEVTLDCNLKGRPWTNKEGVTRYFNTIDVWRVTPTVQQVQQVQQPQYQQQQQGFNQGGQSFNQGRPQQTQQPQQTHQGGFNQGGQAPQQAQGGYGNQDGQGFNQAGQGSFSGNQDNWAAQDTGPEGDLPF